MAAVELEGIAQIIDKISSKFSDPQRALELSSRAKCLAQEIRDAIQKQAIVDHPVFGEILAYEVDGFGSASVSHFHPLPFSPLSRIQCLFSPL